MRLKNLQKKYPKFIYENYSYRISENDLEILFNFKIEPDIFFKPKVVIKNINKTRLAETGERQLNNLVFHLGLIEMFSYWKATSSPEIVIKAGYLNSEQIKWWKNLIINGMGQFFYENKINWKKPNFLKINSSKINSFNSPKFNFPKLSELGESSGENPSSVFSTIVENNNDRWGRERILVPVGGGKDSIVTLEILKHPKKELSSFLGCFSLNPTEAAKKIMKMAAYKNPVIVERKIDKKLLELNRKGFLNGHTPFSAYLAFLSVLLAEIFNYKYIAFSNEKSSNEGNLKYLGKTINHQWSKSFDFEKNFRTYNKKYLVENAEYFSFLRPLYEIQIAKLFSKYPKYFPVFLSCNEAHKTDSGSKKPIKKWCGKCPKCLFIFAALYPFVGEKNLLKIFGKNLFKDKNLLPVMRELVGERKFKPFECVGTKKETLAALYLSYLSFKTSPKIPVLLEYFEKKLLPKYKNLEKESKTILNSWNNQHNLPPRLINILILARKKLNIHN